MYYVFRVVAPRTVGRLFAAVLIVAPCWQGVLAQSDESSLLEEITVTAQKRGDQSMMEVPISISVINGSVLDQSPGDGVVRSLVEVPGVQIYKAAFGNGSKITIRGVASTSSILNGAPTTAFYLDEIPFGFVKTNLVPDVNAYDMEQVEVLRGPQGTLYGASALNGVVRVLTRDADLDNFEFKARASYADIQDGEENMRGDIAINVPLIEGKLAVRGVLGIQDVGGFIDKPIGENTNGGDLKNYRLKVNAKPTERFGIEGLVWVARQNRDGNSAGDADYFNLATVEEPQDTEYEALGLTLSYDFDNVTLTSATSYIDYTYEMIVNLNGFENDINLADEMFSQELRLHSTGDTDWFWSAGILFRDVQDEKFQTVTGLLAFPSSDASESESLAIFGEVTKSFADGKFDLTLGLRYFEDDVQTTEFSTFGAPILPADVVTNKDSFDKTTPRVVLNWYASENANLYASYSEGFRSGFTNGPGIASLAPGLESVAPDSLKNFEIGAKGVAWGSRLTYDVAVYHSEWEDVQTTLGIEIGTPGNSVIQQAPTNGSDASGFGVDAGLSVQLTDNFDLGLSVSTNQMEFDEDNFSGPTLIYGKGSRIAESPETTASIQLGYDTSFGAGGYTGRFEAAANYHSELFAVSTSTGDRLVGDSITNSRASFSLFSPNGKWTTRLFVDNLFDEDGASRVVVNRPQYASRLQPTSIGLQFEYNSN